MSSSNIVTNKTWRPIHQFGLWLVLFCCYNNQALAANELEELRPRLGNEWVQVQNDKRNDIRTYIRHEDDKYFRSFKADMRLDANIRTLASVMLDFDNYTRWYWRTQTSELLKKHSPTHYILYVVHDTPYNIPDLDVILNAIVEPQSASQAAVTIKVSALPDYLPLKPTLKRMIAEDMSIKITPLPKNRVHLEVQGYFEVANTVLPTWAANMIQRTAPYTVLTQLKKMVTLEHYQKANTPIGFAVYNYEEYQAQFNPAHP